MGGGNAVIVTLAGFSPSPPPLAVTRIEDFLILSVVLEG